MPFPLSQSLALPALPTRREGICLRSIPGFMSSPAQRHLRGLLRCEYRMLRGLVGLHEGTMPGKTAGVQSVTICTGPPGSQG